MTYVYSRSGEIVSGDDPIGPAVGSRPGGDPMLVRFWRTALRHKLIIAAIFAACIVLAAIVTVLMKPQYTASATIEISRQEENVANVEGVQPEDAGENAEFYQTQYGLLKSRSLADRVVRGLNLANDDEFFAAFDIETEPADGVGLDLKARQALAARILLDNISIAPVRGSGLIDIEFRSPIPELSARVTNAWANEFIDSKQDRRFASTAGAREFLESRLGELRNRLEESERQLVNYARDREIVNLSTERDGEGNATSQRSLVSAELEALQDALSAATAERIAAASEAGPGVGRTALANPALNSLRQRRAEVAAEYARLLTQFEPGYPAARALQSQIAELDRSIAGEQSRLQAASSTTFREASQREQQLRARLETVKSRLLSQEGDRIQYNIFQREADTNRQLYEALLQRYKEIGVAGVGVSQIAIVDPAEIPNGPSSPNLLLNLLLGLMLGGFLSGLAVVSMEQIDQSITDVDEASRLLGLPVLGAIPLSGDEPVDAIKDPKSSLSEAYVSMRTNLTLATNHGLPRTLMITSTRQAEGKSTTSISIAQVIAKLGRRVLLVDADMRNPSIHRMLDLQNEGGLSSYLAGTDDLTKLILPGPVAGMSILTAGPIPPNPSDLLSGDRMRVLSARLAEEFDTVIIDAPPVLGFADVPLLAQTVEGVAYVVESGGAKVRAIEASLDRIRQVRGHIFGLVVMKVNPQDSDYAYQYTYASR